MSDFRCPMWCPLFCRRCCEVDDPNSIPEQMPPPLNLDSVWHPELSLTLKDTKLPSDFYLSSSDEEEIRSTVDKKIKGKI